MSAIANPPSPAQRDDLGPGFAYRDGQLYIEDVPAAQLASRYGTPLFVYSQGAMIGRLAEIQTAFAEAEPLICYSVKANSNLSLLRLMAEQGSAFDVVSGGELARVLEAGGAGDQTVFAGVGKTDPEIAQGLRAGVRMFNVESEAELEAIARVAQEMGRVAPLALRSNPEVDPKTHRYITTGKKESKFGLDPGRTRDLARRIVDIEAVELIGIHMHIGSQITEVDPYRHAVARGIELIADLRAMGHTIEWFNMGGGFGIAYEGGESRPIAEYAEAIAPAVRQAGCRLALEPGRVISGNAGVLITRVIFTKQSGNKRFLIQDGAMNDLIRPALYGSYHAIGPVVLHDGETDLEAELVWDVVGPICESGDFLAQDRRLPHLDCDDLLAVFSAGAYSMVMASNYNTRPRAAEVLVHGAEARLIRCRETYDDLVALERDDALRAAEARLEAEESA